jgi:N-hydroxyarylamine O-acetyltransferase
MPAGDDLKLQARVEGEWRSLYRFDLQEQFQVDYEISNYYLSTNPASHFVNRIIAALSPAEGRYALINNRLTIHYLNGEDERRELHSSAELCEVLEGLFGIAVPDRAEFDATVARRRLLAQEP